MMNAIIFLQYIFDGDHFEMLYIYTIYERIPYLKAEAHTMCGTV